MDTFFLLWSEEPFVVLGFFAALLVAAGYCVMGAKVKVVSRHEMDDREPEPLRRVVLDATARFPPKASDRRVS